jgi:hypothetical protein
MPAQVLNPHGESSIGKYPLSKIVLAMKSGNKAAAYFSELCNEIPKRKGIEISRLSEIHVLTGTKLKEPIYKKNIEQSAYAEAMKEYTALEPHFKILIGKGMTMDDEEFGDSVGRIAYGSSSNVEYKQPTAVDQAVAKVYAWLQKPQSKLRSLTSLLSGGGLFYVASVHEKCHRAYIAHGMDETVSEQDYAMWARARLCAPNGAGEPTIPNDLEALL